MSTEIKRVKTKYGTCKQLAVMFKVTTRTISNAISGTSNTPIAKKIRIAAVKMGGDAIYN
jgi:transcriptional antiterminator